MKPITMEQVLKTFKEYFLMTVGMMLYSFAWIGCIMPADGTGGGATGLSRVLCHAVEHWAGISIQIGTMAFLINGVLLLVAGFIIGWNFGVKTVFCVCVISLGLNFWQSVLPEGDFLHLERILSVILGGILAGIGVAICFMQGGSTGGTDIAAMIINKYRTISYGKIVIYSDFVIIGSSMLVGFHIDTVIYGYVMTAVFGYTVDMIMAGNQQSSQVFIVTHDGGGHRREYPPRRDAHRLAGVVHQKGVEDRDGGLPQARDHDDPQVREDDRSRSLHDRGIGDGRLRQGVSSHQ